MHQSVLIFNILQEARDAGIELQVRNGNVIVTGSRSVITRDLLARIRENKADIIRRLEAIERVLREIGA